MEYPITPKLLDNLVLDLSKFAVNDKLLEQFKLTNTDKSTDTISKTFKIANIDNIKELGIIPPTGFRISPRIFEESKYFNKDNKDTKSKDIFYDRLNGILKVKFNGQEITIKEKNKTKLKINSEADVIQQSIKEAFEVINTFVCQESFLIQIAKLYELQGNDQLKFLRNTILNRKKLIEAGVKIPKDVQLQRSYFFDNRPTLFAVTKKIKNASPWYKVTVTFDEFNTHFSNNDLPVV